MSVLRTPDVRFADLPQFPFEPHYTTIEDGKHGPLRMHYLDEGPRTAPVVLMLHGEPTWSFLYRKIIPEVVAAGYRAVAPDYIGFGRSDKLVDRHAYTYQGYVDWLVRFIEILELRHIILFGQDWGGPIGLRLVHERPGHFDAIIASNTVLPNCEPPPRGIPDWPGPIIEPWAASTRDATDFPVSEIIAGVFAKPPDPRVLQAYEAPYPDAAYKAGAIQFPSLIPVRSHMPGIAENRRTWKFLEHFEKPFVTVFSEDPGTKPWETVFRTRIPGARGQPHVELADCGHFVQEEQSRAVSAVILELLRRLYE
jgi:haloalkane dehalogenase